MATDPHPPRITAVDAALHYCAHALQSAAMRLGAGPYALGTDFSGADIHLLTCLNSAVHRGLALPASLAEYRQRLLARAAYQQAFARNRLA